jgi:hypothetical protein
VYSSSGSLDFAIYFQSEVFILAGQIQRESRKGLLTKAVLERAGHEKMGATFDIYWQALPRKSLKNITPSPFKEFQRFLQKNKSLWK